MNKGQGSIARTNKVDTVVVPPATVTGARNGLSVIGTNVELGSVGTPLLHNTSVVMGGFVFSLLNGANVQFIIDPTAGSYSMGDANAAVNGTFLNINDAIQFVEIQSSGDGMLELDRANSLYRFGDISGTGNLTKIDVKDASQAIELDAGTSPGRLTLVGNPGTESLTVDFAASPYFTLDPNAGNYFMGDLGGVNNTTTLTLSDSVSQAAISSLGFSMLFLDMPNGIFQLGASAGGTVNTSYFQVDDAAQTFSTNSSGNTNGLLVDLATFNFKLGDFSGSSNGTEININDSLSKIQLVANNGVGINMFPLNSKFAVVLQSFANNAAAVVGGLGVGDFYRISVAGTSAVAVVE